MVHIFGNGAKKFELHTYVIYIKKNLRSYWFLMKNVQILGNKNNSDHFCKKLVIFGGGNISLFS